jgi:hypothetical protein
MVFRLRNPANNFEIDLKQNFAESDAEVNVITNLLLPEETSVQEKLFCQT